MPQLRFRNFSSLAFLQAVDKPRFLSRLLAPHAAYFLRHDLDVNALTHDDACARRLLEIFTQPDGEMPGDLLQVLYVLDEVADDAGRERILQEAERAGIDLGGIADDAGAGDFALAVHLDHPRLIRICHEKTVCQKVKRYYEFRSRDDRRLSLGDVRAKVGEVQDVLGPWFDERKRTSTCEVFAYEEGWEIRFLVTHGALYRTDGSITPARERSRIGYWPQRHDSLIYDTRSGLLKIHAQFPAERNAYREAFGQALFADPAYFPECAPYTLKSLRTNGGVLAVVEGMKGVWLTEVWIEVGSQECHRHILKGDDVAAMVAGAGSLDVFRGEIVLAGFSIEHASGGRARKLEVRLPNVADHDRDRDGPVVEAFLRANNFLVAGAHGVDSGRLVAAA